jgi:curved DNA-binding protein CbpA
VTDLPDYYAILGLSPGASQAEIRAAYRKLALAHHPDVSPAGRERGAADDAMSRINEAYETLSDPRRREAYDRQRYARRTVRHPYQPRWRAPRRQSARRRRAQRPAMRGAHTTPAA